jgi:hypothetical protein
VFGLGVGFIKEILHMTTSTITRKQVPVKDRIQSTAKLFGKHFMYIEGLVYDISGHFAVNSYWQFYLLDNGGFYMAPDHDNSSIALDALGLGVCLYVFGHLRAVSNDPLAEICARQFHLLMNYVLERPEAANILGAIN